MEPSIPENHSLDVLKQKALTSYQHTPGLEAFPDSATQIPRLIIGQPSNISDYAAGKFIDNLTGLAFESLDVVLLKMSRSRVLWKAGKPSPGDTPLCKSQNAISPDQDFYNRRCVRCMNDETNTHIDCVDERDRPVCEHAKFLHGERPECRLNYHLLVVVVQTGDPYILTVSGRSISPTNKLLSAFKVRGRPAYSARFTISLAKPADGDYYVVKYSNIHWFESVDELKNLFESFKNVNLTMSQPEADTNGTQDVSEE
jgi:hypothetical protein